MIPIYKKDPPPELVKLQEWAKENNLSPKNAYDTLQNPQKEQVRKQLVEEQGGLCAYCMCRIPEKKSEITTHIKIEHIIPRNPVDRRDVGQGLDYNNFLAVCYGNEGTSGDRKIRKEDLTCDAHRKNTEFRKINPIRPETLESIVYNMNGEISATDQDVDYDLQKTLNLNSPTAPRLAERKAALDALVDDIGALDGDELLSYCQTILSGFEAESSKKTPYVGILIWWLKSLIHGLREADT